MYPELASNPDPPASACLSLQRETYRHLPPMLSWELRKLYCSLLLPCIKFQCIWCYCKGIRGRKCEILFEVGLGAWCIGVMERKRGRGWKDLDQDCRMTFLLNIPGETWANDYLTPERKPMIDKSQLSKLMSLLELFTVMWVRSYL